MLQPFEELAEIQAIKRMKCLKLALVNESNPDQAIIDAGKFYLFVTGEPQATSGDADADRG